MQPHSAVPSLRVVSWNVNGLRACANKGFAKWARRARLDVLGLQEVRALPDEVPDDVRRLRLHQHFAPAQRRGYSGVALLSKRSPDGVETTLARRFDVEGRMIVAHFGRLSVCSAYVPKGSGTARDNSRIPYKLAFDRALRMRMNALRDSGQRVIVMGDFNTAHEAIDLARPKQNVDNSGFRPEERRAFGRWMKDGWVDTFRHFHPDAPGHYTWWSQRMGLREKNVGWRIDYVLACPAALAFVQSAFIWPKVRGSDHCPLGVTLRPEVR